MGRREPRGESPHILLRINPEAISVIDRAAAKEGLDRSDFMRRAIGAAVRSSTGEDLPEDHPSPPGEDPLVT